jgi:diadenosine tetraphosphatase ApaH/serine/threonine PP2A family protein phosphatase
MRYAIVSDIHANLQAWNAVLADTRVRDVDRILCLGDIVGYGPAPAEVMSSVHRHASDLVLGNHDAVIAGLLSPDSFNDHAQRLIQWTSDQLDDKARDYLAAIPLVVRGPGFRLAHAEFSDHGRFYYLENEDDAHASWQAVPEPLLFCGHTHHPQIYILDDGRCKTREPVDFYLEPEKRYIVNVGSVGLSRDGDFRACYCVFNDEEQTVEFRRVPYDMEAFESAVREGFGGSPQSDYLIDLYRGHEPPVRETIVFSPKSGKGVDRRAVLEAELQALSRETRQWKRAACLAAVALAIVAGLFVAFLQQLPEPITIAGAAAPPMTLAPAQTYSLLVSPAPAPLPPGWRCELADQRQQQVELDADRLVFTSTDTELPLTVTLPPLDVGDREAVQWRLRGELSPDYRGEVPVLAIAFVDGDTVYKETVITFNREDDGSIRKQRTLQDIPKRTSELRPAFRCAFSGSVTITELSIRPRARK